MGGLNQYQYCPNPVEWVDPLGLKCEDGKSSEATNGVPLTQAQIEEIQAIPKGQRPDPSEYLPKSYIDAHLQKFNDGASYFAPKWALDEFGRDPVGRVDGQFVMTSKQVSEILNRTNGYMRLIEKELGIPEGAWQGQEMVVVNIPNPKSVNLRMPTGNEGGANDLWIPRGKLPTGHDEAVTDAIPKSAYSEMDIETATAKAKK